MAPNDSTPAPRLQGESTPKLRHYLLVFACADTRLYPGIGRRRASGAVDFNCLTVTRGRVVETEGRLRHLTPATCDLESSKVKLRRSSACRAFVPTGRATSS